MTKEIDDAKTKSKAAAAEAAAAFASAIFFKFFFQSEKVSFFSSQRLDWRESRPKGKSKRVSPFFPHDMVFYFDIDAPECGDNWIVYMVRQRGDKTTEEKEVEEQRTKRDRFADDGSSATSRPQTLPSLSLFLSPQGRDKHENESLIAHALPHDIWFHVEDMSSAHVYLRPPSSLCPAVVASAKPGKGSSPAGGGGRGAGGSASAAPSPSGRAGAGGEDPAAPPLPPRAWHDIPPQVLADCCQLVKHNSISGSRAASVDVVFTPAPNLLKTDRMDTGQVRSFAFVFVLVYEYPPPRLFRGDIGLGWVWGQLVK